MNTSVTTSTVALTVGIAAACVCFWTAGGDRAAVAGERPGAGATAQRAPISLAELDLIKKSVLWGPEDDKHLRMSLEVLRPHVSELVGVWYGFVGANDHLLDSFRDPSTGEPVGPYLEGVRVRFEQWVLDTAAAEHDQAWLDHQFEIGRRHHRTGKNRTDGVNASEHVPFRYIPALTIPITTTMKPFLARAGHSEDEVEKMHAAWVKIVTVQAILWSYPYIRSGDF